MNKYTNIRVNLRISSTGCSPHVDFENMLNKFCLFGTLSFEKMNFVYLEHYFLKLSFIYLAYYFLKLKFVYLAHYLSIWHTNLFLKIEIRLFSMLFVYLAHYFLKLNFVYLACYSSFLNRMPSRQRSIS